MRREVQTMFSLPRSGARVISSHLYLHTLEEFKEGGVAQGMVETIEGFKGGDPPVTSGFKR